VLDLGNKVFGLERTALDDSQCIVALFNFTDRFQTLDRNGLPGDLELWEELIGEASVRFVAGGLRLPPYAACWFSNRLPRRRPAMRLL
jgi:hypothetical protein